jgi:hypothetical protein
MKTNQEPTTVLMHSAMYTALGQDAHTSAAAFHAQRRCSVTEPHGDERLYCAPIKALARTQTGVARLQSMLMGLWPQVQEMLAMAPAHWPLHVSVMLPDGHATEQASALAVQCLAQVKQLRPIQGQGRWHLARSDCAPTQWVTQLHQRSLSAAGARRGSASPVQPELHLILAAQSQCDVQVLQTLHAQGQVGHTQAKHLPTPGEGATALLWGTGISANSAKTSLPAHALTLRAAAYSQPTAQPRWPSETVADSAALLSVLQQSLQQAQLQSWQVSHWSDDNEDQDWRNADQIQALQRLLATASDPDAAWLAKPLRTIAALGHQGEHNTWVQLAMAHSLHRLRLQKLHNLLCTEQSPTGACAALLLQARAGN